MNVKYFIVSIVLIVLIGFPTSSVAHSNQVDPIEAKADIKIGAILPLTGDLASKGKMRETAISLAVDEVNEYFTQAGYSYRLQLIVRDSKSDPAEVLNQAKDLYEEGTSLFIAGSSAEIAELKPWSDKTGTVVISYSSTAPSLEVAGDGIFRVVPSDQQQAYALATLLEQEGIEHIVPIYRNDVYGQELTEYLSRAFKELQPNGHVLAPVSYDTSQSDFTKIIDQVEAQLASSELAHSKTGIVLVSFDEAKDILLQADALQDMRWFGTDTVTLSPIILENDTAAAVAAKVKLTGVTFGANTSTSLYSDVKASIEQKLGQSIIPDVIFAYDIPWMLATVFQKMDKPGEINELKERLVELSANYAGATGWMLLNESGDRKYSMYDIWQVKEHANSYDWELVGKYRRDPGLPGYIVNEQPSEQYNEILSGIFMGFNAGSNDLDHPISREEYVYLLDQMLDLSCEGEEVLIKDAHLIHDKAVESVLQAGKCGIINGYADGSFRLEAELSRAEMIAMTVRALQLTVTVESDMTATHYHDDAAIPSWARGYVVTAATNGLLDINERFGAADSVSLADANLFVWYAMNLKQAIE